MKERPQESQKPEEKQPLNPHLDKLKIFPPSAYNFNQPVELPDKYPHELPSSQH